MFSCKLKIVEKISCECIVISYSTDVIPDKFKMNERQKEDDQTRDHTRSSDLNLKSNWLLIKLSLSLIRDQFSVFI